MRRLGLMAVFVLFWSVVCLIFPSMAPLARRCVLCVGGPMVITVRPSLEHQTSHFGSCVPVESLDLIKCLAAVSLSNRWDKNGRRGTCPNIFGASWCLKRR
ncbi:hypothetical protein B0H63DRAFT_486414 [Podospora didyma]|uniref:Secreted protein n=1 Tax=Podospora didyma TaxID=330526 RepID=A0AAE0K5V9_9PEZI|nr:hypothetical protein B0H63DRAFT_486414 [Podospora didyma]